MYANILFQLVYSQLGSWSSKNIYFFFSSFCHKCHTSQSFLCLGNNVLCWIPCLCYGLCSFCVFTKNKLNFVCLHRGPSRSRLVVAEQLHSEKPCRGPLQKFNQVRQWKNYTLTKVQSSLILRLGILWSFRNH